MALDLSLNVIFLVVGGLLSWLITHRYYRRSTVEVPTWIHETPEWAIPLIEALPDQPISLDRLIELYQNALDNGEISVDPHSGYVKCPRCGASSSQFESWQDMDDRRGDLYYGMKCRACGCEVSGEQA